VPRLLTQYRVFIGSPGGLDEERKCFRDKLEKYSEMHSEPRNVVFQPVGWEETVGGVGRPQELINEDLKQCDYAVFILHDRWGSSTGGLYTSGVEEEWALAETLYKANKVRNIALFFKKVDPRQLRDPGTQLNAVLAFKKRIEAEKRYLFRQYDSGDQFAEALEAHLSKWLRDHEGAVTGSLPSSSPTADTIIDIAGVLPSGGAPRFGYWVAETARLLEPDTLNSSAALFCATRAIEAARSDIEWAQAKNGVGVAQFHLGKVDEAIEAFTTIAERFSASIEIDRRYWQAKALINKGITLGALDRSADAIAVYDDLVARFGTASELPLREQVANALLNKGVTLGALDRNADAIAVYDDLINRFGTATDLPLCEQVKEAELQKRNLHKS
jgi:tetratricopeptide (TPR) repeat protein